MIRSQTIESKADLEDGSWKGVLNAVRFVMQATLRTTMRATPMQLVYGHNAIHNIRVEADWQYIKRRQQQVIHQNNEHENACRVPHTYNVGDQVMVEQPQHRKYGEPKYKGPVTVDHVNDNDMLHFSIPEGAGTIYKIWNIRNIHPYTARSPVQDSDWCETLQYIPYSRDTINYKVLLVKHIKYFVIS